VHDAPRGHETRSADQAALGFSDVKVGVSARLIRLLLQFALQCQQVVFQVEFEIATVADRACRAARRDRPVEVGEGVNLWIQVLERLHVVHPNFGRAARG